MQDCMHGGAIPEKEGTSKCTNEEELISMDEEYAAYMQNHSFAVCFTAFAAASQGLGGLIAVLGLSQEEYGNMVDTSEKIGETSSSFAFFAGIGVFLLLEVLLPEVEGTQVAVLLGMSDAPAAATLRAAEEPAALGGAAAALAEVEPPAVIERQARRRVATGAASCDGGSEREPRREARSPACTRPPEPSTPPRATSAASRKKARQSPTPSEKRQAYEESGEPVETQKTKQRVAFSGLMAMVSISLHNIPEGVAVYLTCLKGVKSGLPLAIAMSLHIPEGMAVAGPLYAATKSKSKAVLAATVSGSFEVVGCLLVQLFFTHITPFFLEAMLSLVAGIMVGLALIELLPSCLEILKPVPMGCSCAAGMLFMFVSKSLSNELIAALA